MSWAQIGEVPPDYPAQAAQYPTNPVDAQIEAVRRNYEDVKARAQLRLDAERRAKEEREAAQAKAQAREKARARAAAEARAKEAARKAAKQEKFQDEERELELEMKRLDVRSKRTYSPKSFLSSSGIPFLAGFLVSASAFAESSVAEYSSSMTSR